MRRKLLAIGALLGFAAMLSGCSQLEGYRVPTAEEGFYIAKNATEIRVYGDPESSRELAVFCIEETGWIAELYEDAPPNPLGVSRGNFPAYDSICQGQAKDSFEWTGELF